MLADQVRIEKEIAAEADDQRMRLTKKKEELEEYLHDLGKY